MGDKIRGSIAILVGMFGLFRSYQLWHAGLRGSTPWLLLAAGLVLISIGAWRIRRKPADAAAELLK
jgi:ABC-type nickel/cobalt efflux system permease component RcnA